MYYMRFFLNDGDRIVLDVDDILQVENGEWGFVVVTKKKTYFVPYANLLYVERDLVCEKESK